MRCLHRCGVRNLLAGPGTDFGSGFLKSRRLLQFPAHLTKRLEQRALLVDSVRMKIVQVPEAHAGNAGLQACQHFVEIVAIDCHGLPAGG